MKFRFEYDEINNHYKVKARLKTTKKWVEVGFCHISAKPFLERGERVNELLRLTYALHSDHDKP